MSNPGFSDASPFRQLDPERMRRYERLKELDEIGPLYAGLYKEAAELLEFCDELWAIIYVSHCGRDVLNRLPEIDVGKITSNEAEETAALRTLIETWLADGLSVERLNTEDLQISVSAELIRALSAFMKERKTGEFTNRMKSEIIAAKRVVIPDADDSMTLRGAQIHKTRKWFMRYTHVPAKYRETPPREEVEQHFRLFEELLDDYLDAFSIRHAAVQSLLFSANRRGQSEGDKDVEEVKQ